MPNALALQIFAGVHNDRRHRQFAEHHGRVAAQVCRIGQQDHLNRLPLLVQLPCRHEPVTAVVTLAAENRNPLRATVMRQNMLRDG